MSSRRPVEAEQILTALERLGPTPMTSCPGWSAHHVAAHITGNYQEVRRHVEGFAAGRPVDRTRDWEEREAPLRELDHGELLALLEREEAAMRASVVEALDEHGDSTLMWAGRTVRLAGFLTHMRSEDAVHRWDLVGDDDESATLLGQQELLEHAVHFVGEPLCRRGLAQGAGAAVLSARIRAGDHDDLLVEMGHGNATLTVLPRDGEEVLSTDPAARLLLVWGRKATPFFRLRSRGNTAHVAAVQHLFSGY
jgi:hypothetical protein